MWDAVLARSIEGYPVAVLAQLALRPVPIRPEPRQIHLAITDRCNQACIGCRYGRDFMPGAQLQWPVVRDLLDDAREAGIWQVRFYGGEPLLHPDLVRMVARAVQLGLEPYVTTNGVLLRRRIDAPYEAGLRFITLGFYGVDAAYDAYVQRGGFAHMESGIAAVRERYGEAVRLRINWLLMRRRARSRRSTRCSPSPSATTWACRSTSCTTRCRVSPRGASTACSSGPRTSRRCARYR